MVVAGVAGGLSLAAVTFGVGGWLASSYRQNKDETEDENVLPPVVFYVVWPVLVALLCIVFGILVEATSVKWSKAPIKNTKRTRLAFALALCVMLAGLTLLYSGLIPTLKGEERANASIIITLITLLLAVTQAFLVGSVKKGLGALMAPWVAWLIVAQGLAVEDVRQEKRKKD